MRLTGAQRGALAFVAKHPGTRHRAFPAGYVFHFDAPEVKRAPFRVTTIYQLINLGLITAEGPVVLTPRGQSKLPSSSS